MAIPLLLGPLSLGAASLAVAAGLSLPMSGTAIPGPTDAEIGVDVPDVIALQTVPNELRYGDSGPWVELLNQKLLALGFNANDDDEFKRRTRHAVYAFKKHHGLERNGKILSEHWPLLNEEIVLPFKPELDRVEVNLKKQVLYLVEDGRVELVLPVSSGNGASFYNEDGKKTYAVTPEGKFDFMWNVRGLRVSYLGELWNPFYFWNGYAIHGSPSVPNYPASHGCVRTTFWDMNVLKDRLELGQTIYVYGKRKPVPGPVTVEPPPVVVI